MDCIRIINLKIPGRHGVYEFEKEKDGLFELDVELFLDLKSAGKSDDLAKTVNYGEAVGIITDVFNSKDRTSKLTYWSADLIKFETKSSSNQFLILSEIFYEDGWELFCNGTKQEIYQVNKIVRGLKVPRGINSFEMRFNPIEFYYGLFITRIAVALIILVFIYLLVRRYYGKKS